MKSKIILLLIFLTTIAFGGPAFSATYTYDNANRLKTIDHENGTLINYDYDDNGNLISTNVLVDVAPPTGSITINNGAAATNSENVTLTLSAADDSGIVSAMRFSDDNVTWYEWEAYATSTGYVLPSGIGNKTIYVQFKDVVGKISDAYSASIIFDNETPLVSITPEGGLYTSVQNVSISVNEQATVYYTTDGSVPTTFSAVYSAPIALNASATIKYFAMDVGGNSSAVQEQTYTIDLLPPSGSVVINGGAATTNSEFVTLTLSASDDGGTVSQMRFSNDNAAWSEWEAYATTKAWTLLVGDGSKTVYVQFSDPSNRISESFSSTIVLDTVAPILTASPAGGFFNSMVFISLSSNKPGTTIYYTMDGTTPTLQSWVWSGPFGLRTDSVTIKFLGVDTAGNVSTVQTEIYTVDPWQPTGSIAINGGQQITNSRSVNLTLSASDFGSTVTQMRFSNDALSWSDWESFATAKAWTILIGDGNKTVYVQYKDAAGNTSITYSSTITLDTTAPVVSASPVGGSFASAQNVSLSANEQATLYYTIDGSVPTTASPVYSSPIPLNTSTTLKFIGVDAAGNQSAVQTESYIIDSAAPTGSISINGGAASTNTESVTLILSATDNSGTVSQMRFSNDNATWSAWEPYGTTKAWTLSSGGGSKTVYVEFKDPSENVSATYLDSITLNVNGIDLVVSIDSVPASKPTGTAMTVGYTPQNLGTVTQAPFEVRFYLASDPVNTANDVLLRTEYISDIWPEGGYNTFLTIPISTAAGTYYVRAVIDAGNTNAETNESNNTAVSSAITVTKEIDLVVSIDSVPASRPSGSTMAIAYTLQNLGTAKQAPFEVRFYLASDPVNTVNDVLLRTESVSEIWPDGYNTSLMIPSNTAAGIYHVRAVVDATNTNVETNESNNSVVSSPITITKEIDLVVSIDSVPSSKPSGSSMTIAYTLQNLGTAKQAPFEVRFYLASDPVNTANDVLLRTESVSEIWPDGYSTSLMIPASTAAGTYYVRAVVDATNTNVETNENNNSVVSSAITVTQNVDLVVSIDNAPASAQTGANISVSYTVSNNGTGASAGSWLKFYLSADTVIDSSDTILGSKGIVSVAGGGSSSGTASLIIPLNTVPGSYYIIGKADSEDENVESNETNNIGVSSGTIAVTQ